MKRFLLPLMMIGLFYSDSLFMEWFPEQAFDGKWVFVPRFFIVGLVLMTIFYDRATAIKYGLVFGFLFDLFYTGILGAYMFFLPFIVYVTSKLVKVFQNHLFIIAFVVLIDIVLFEVIMYQLNILVQRTDMLFTEFMNVRLWPTLVVNAVFYIFLSIPLRNVFIKMRRDILND
ncbi:MAG TPA: rod shape-determining protein MreD [Chondromyces sp.]|nr:rod shape-determining protein MreD [Chondromyces sp.]